MAVSAGMTVSGSSSPQFKQPSLALNLVSSSSDCSTMPCWSMDFSSEASCLADMKKTCGLVASHSGCPDRSDAPEPGDLA